DSLEAVAARIDAVPLYHLHIARIGGTPQAALIQALEAFALTRYAGDSPWDRIERTALTKAGAASSDPVIAGYQLFVGKAQCGVCHSPPLYTDQGFHKVAPNPFNDKGHQGGFKTPTLRGAATRTSFFHAGSVKSLEDAVAQYQKPVPDADPVAAKIKLSSDEVAQVVAFLKALTADQPAPTKPVLP
ncbi:MAG TPA: c-type cytochrome, partial [Kofleriaceae bacterium]